MKWVKFQSIILFRVLSNIWDWAFLLFHHKYMTGSEIDFFIQYQKFRTYAFHITLRKYMDVLLFYLGYVTTEWKVDHMINVLMWSVFNNVLKPSEPCAKLAEMVNSLDKN